MSVMQSAALGTLPAHENSCPWEHLIARFRIEAERCWLKSEQGHANRTKHCRMNQSASESNDDHISSSTAIVRLQTTILPVIQNDPMVRSVSKNEPRGSTVSTRCRRWCEMRLALPLTTPA
jgi:hypothetical protein